MQLIWGGAEMQTIIIFRRKKTQFKKYIHFFLNMQLKNVQGYEKEKTEKCMKKM